MLLYGASVAVGNIAGGKLADRIGVAPSLTLIFTGLVVSLVALGYCITQPDCGHRGCSLLGGFAFANVPPLQSYVVQIAREVAPAADLDVASGLNIGAFNLGIAGGAWAGGLVVQKIGLAGGSLYRCCGGGGRHCAGTPVGSLNAGAEKTVTVG